MKAFLTVASAAMIFFAASRAEAQECKPADFTIQDVEKIDFSDIVKYSGYSLLEQKSSEERKQKYSGSAVIYGVPVSLSYDDSKSLSNYMLQKSGFDYSRDTRFSLVRTALSSVGASMYSDCLAAQSIRLEVPRQAYTERSFQLAVTWDPKLKTPQNVDFEIRIIGGTVEGKTKLIGKIPEKTAKLFRIDKTNELMQIDLVVYGQKYPSIVIPPTSPVHTAQFFKRYGSYSPARNLSGNVCGHYAYLVAEFGSSAGSDTKTCRLCVVRSPDGLLLQDTAELEGLPNNAASEKLDPIKSGLEMCATFTAVGRGKNGPRTEVQDGRFYVYEAVIK
jgi:hypothetical protein